MRFKSTVLKELVDQTVVCIGWTGNDEIIIGRSDSSISKWSQATKENIKLCDLSDQSYPIDLHMLSNTQRLINKTTGIEQILITSSNGKLHLMSKTSKIDKSIDAHEGNVTVGRWSPDGSTLLTAGEDGCIKIWSRIGMLRTKLVINGEPILSADWNSDSSKIVYTQHDMLCIKSLKANIKPIRILGHSDIILKVSWCKANEFIVSGGEDCYYKIWDAYGNSIFVSDKLAYPVTSLNWKSDGNLLVVSYYNTILLCNQYGIILSTDYVDCGSVNTLCWSPDGTQVAAACANGKLMVSTLIERSVSEQNFNCLITSRKRMIVKDILNETKENLDFPERIIHVAMKYNHLIVTTCTQCFVYQMPNLNTPQIINLKDTNVFMINLTKKYFAVFSLNSVNIYTFDCKLVSSPKWPNMQCDVLQTNHVSISDHVLAVRDQLNDKMVHVFEIMPLSTLQTIKHGFSVTDIQLMSTKSQDKRFLALIDSSMNIFIVHIGHNNEKSKTYKLGSMFHSMCWNNQTESLAALQYTNLIVWYDPLLLLNDQILVRKALEKSDLSFYGNKLSIESYWDNVVSMINTDSVKISVQVSPYLEAMKNYIGANKWMDCQNVCRNVNNEAMWALLAGSAVLAKQLDTAEECFLAIGQNERATFIQHIKTLSDKTVQESSLALLTGNTSEAESILLRNGYTFKAVMFNVQIYNWKRALELALKHKKYLQIVIYERRNYLEFYKKQETSDRFLKYSDMEINNEDVLKEIEKENQQN
ncbi:WD40/YVTN repeat-like-containing domain,WD40 repeat,WD40-repeat-containing domain [Cinara cedri]|uniref:WD40/YVTN repeat-like-containing domain,WD40 repeat,WD40-repeat-containing domain n=1 Tax=Cinara cedri TaxID=506608 RepID=A0A5E4MLI5_9HEMI|nr:WD40/YVTN repeat-like-containing domain,WD40 repeat,WD40-repeat-containing domain [Cinara cedri]